MGDLAGLLEVRIDVFDTFGSSEEVLSDPQAFGFTNITEACVDNLQDLLAGCPGFLFFDAVHPTTAAHALLGASFFAAVPWPSTLALLIGAGGALLLVGARGRRHRTA
jgi:phospholipase/lecithinase/hemolysin